MRVSVILNRKIIFFEFVVVSYDSYCWGFVMFDDVECDRLISYPDLIAIVGHDLIDQENYLKYLAEWEAAGQYTSPDYWAVNTGTPSQVDSAGEGPVLDDRYADYQAFFRFYWTT